MSSRIRHETTAHVRKPSHTSSLKTTKDENKIVQPGLKAKTTLGASTRPNPIIADTKPQTPGLKNKSSRPVLASLTNATPRPKPVNPNAKASRPAGSSKPSGGFKTPSAPKVRPHQTPGVKTPSAAPKSSKKGISVYTPARKPTSDELDVEHTHPRPPPLEDGPPTPVREAVEGRWSCTEPEHDPGMDPLVFELEPPSSPEPISRGVLDSPKCAELTTDFDFDQVDDYGL